MLFIVLYKCKMAEKFKIDLKVYFKSIFENSFNLPKDKFYIIEEIYPLIF